MLAGKKSAGAARVVCCQPLSQGEAGPSSRLVATPKIISRENKTDNGAKVNILLVRHDAELELVIETSTKISDQDFVEMVIKLEEVEEVKLFTVNFNPEENKQRFYMKITPAIIQQLNTTTEERKKIF